MKTKLDGLIAILSCALLAFVVGCGGNKEEEAAARLTSAEEGAAAPEATVEPAENSSISMIEVTHMQHLLSILERHHQNFF